MSLKIQKYYYIIFILIITLGIGLRLIGLNKGIWFDEYYSIARVSNDNFFESLRNDNQPPTYFMILKLWSTFSKQEAFLRIPSIIFGVISIFLIMIWIKPISIDASLLAGFMFSTMPILIRYSQEIRGYSLLILSTVFSFYCSYKIVTKENSYWYFLLAISLTIAATTHLIGIMVLPTIGIYLLINFMQWEKRIQWLKVSLAFLFPTIIFFAIYFFFFNNLYGQNWWMPPFSFRLFRSQFKYVLGIEKLLFPTSVFEGINIKLALLFEFMYKSSILITIFVILFFGVWRKSWSLLLAALIYWLQIILVSVFFYPIFWYRTILIGVIPLIGYLALHSTSIKNNIFRIIATLGIFIIFIILAVGWFFIEARIPNEPWRQAAHYLETETKPNDIIIFYPNNAMGPIRYYFRSLSDENVIAVDLDVDIDEFISELSCKMNLFDNKDQQVTLHLVVRESLNVQKEKEKYESLKNYLELVSGRNTLVQDYGIIKFYHYENIE